MESLSSGRTTYTDNLASLKRAQKPSFGTAAYSRHVNRPLGRRFAALAHVVGMSPNQATAISALCSGAGIVILAVASPSVVSGVVVSVLLALGYVWDSVDGQLARLRGGDSLSGEWLDHTIDCIKTSTLHLAVLISWFRYPPTDNDALLLLPVLYEVVQVVTFFGFVVMPFLRKGRTEPSPTTGHENPLRKWLILPTDYGAVCWIFVLMGWPTLFAGVYGFFAVVNAALLAVALRKWWRELSALDAAAAGAA